MVTNERFWSQRYDNPGMITFLSIMCILFTVLDVFHTLTSLYSYSAAEVLKGGGTWRAVTRVWLAHVVSLRGLGELASWVLPPTIYIVEVHLTSPTWLSPAIELGTAPRNEEMESCRTPSRPLQEI